ncbi:MAG TPA: OsmC family protein [Bryobacteraceae bacterium]|nr:OsmC family protein [Bryobacteraceae bacterium]
MEVRIRHGKGMQSEGFARFHRIVCDQPFDEGGSDSGMTPPELMLASIGCCAMHYAAEFLRTRNLALDGVELRVTAEKGGRPVRLIEIGIEVDAPGLTTRARDGLLRAVESCLLHRTLINPSKIKVSVTPVLPVVAPETDSADLAS